MIFTGSGFRTLLIAVLAFLFSFTASFASRTGSTDRPGLDYKSFDLSAPNPDLCENACKKDSNCRAWTYSWPGAKGPKAMCALKTGVPPKRSDTCCISGVKSTFSPITKPDDPVAKSEDPVPAPKKPVIAKPVPTPSEPEEKRDIVTVTPKAKPRVPTLAPEPKPKVLDQAKIATCNDYARRAVAQNSENKRLRCGLFCSRWGYARVNYFDYCMRSPSSAFNGSRAARDRELDTCKRRIAARDDDDGPDITLPEINVPSIDGLFNGNSRTARFCRNFARQSVRQVREARSYDCGFGGSLWSSNRSRQARLCERVGARKATSILNRRSRQIRRCRRADGGNSAGGTLRGCREYARLAVSQARAARRFDCGYGGSRWTSSYRAHLRWCRKVSERKSRAEYRRRERLLDQCE